MIDLHSHILPGIDDGARDLDEAVAMCQMAARDGCKVLVATPHLRHERFWNGDRRPLEKLHHELREAVGDLLQIELGGEIAVHSESLAELEALPGGELLPLAGSRYLLLELDWHGLGPDPLDVVHEIVVAGWWPVIAHPERVAWLAGNRALLAALVEHGACLQLTAMSLTGQLGRDRQVLCAELLAAGLVHFIASDAHSPTIRPPGLRQAYETVVRLEGEATARRLFVTHPLAVLENRPLPAVRTAPAAGLG